MVFRERRNLHVQINSQHMADKQFYGWHLRRRDTERQSNSEELHLCGIKTLSLASFYQLIFMSKLLLCLTYIRPCTVCQAKFNPKQKTCFNHCSSKQGIKKHLINTQIIENDTLLSYRDLPATKGLHAVCISSDRFFHPAVCVFQ